MGSHFVSAAEAVGKQVTGRCVRRRRLESHIRLDHRRFPQRLVGHPTVSHCVGLGERGQVAALFHFPRVRLAKTSVPLPRPGEPSRWRRYSLPVAGLCTRLSSLEYNLKGLAAWPKNCQGDSVEDISKSN